MRQWRTGVFFAVSCIVFFFSFGVEAGVFDPASKWRTISTPHFNINYPEVIEDIAQRAAAIFEDVHKTLSPELRWKPWPPTEIVLVDSTDEANGFATVLPYNAIVLYVAPPRADGTIADYDDWLRLLITHEYTHILHLDAAGGVWWPLRLIFGKAVAPAGILPVWVREGFAVYEETKHTHGGRGHSTFTDMMLRTDVLEGRFLNIDEADGFGWKWPSYNAAYHYGVAFIEYLVDTYGEAKFLEFNRRVQHSLLLSIINGHAKRIYGKTFYALWHEWHGVLKEKYDKQRLALGEVTPFEEVHPSQHDELYSAPALSPDGKTIAFSVDSPHSFSQIRLLDLETGKERTLVKRQGALQMSWFPDGSSIIYSSVAFGYKQYYRYFDLWRYDVATGKVTRLTASERARDPAVDPTKKRVLYIAGGDGVDRLKLYDLEQRTVSSLTPTESLKTQFSHPQWSPDGKSFVVTMHTPEEGWKLYLFSAEGEKLRRVTQDPGNEVDAIWSADGMSLFYSSDKTGISNIYQADLATGQTTQLSTTLTGLFHPTSLDGKHFIVQRYSSAGFDLKGFTAPATPSVSPQRHLGRKKNGASELPATAELSDKAEAQAGMQAKAAVAEAKESSVSDGEETTAFQAKKYSPFGKALLLPRFLAPNVFFTGDTALLGATTLASDPLHWHTWAAGAAYRLDAHHLGYYGQYTYNRFLPAVGIGINDYVVNYGNLTFNEGLATRTVQYFEERRSPYAFVAYPFRRHVFSTSYFYEDHFPKTTLNAAETAALNTGIFSGFRFGYTYGYAEFFPASISPENGRRVRLYTSITDKALGTRRGNEQVIFSGDWREYVRLWAHHTLALRAAGGVTFRDQLIQGTFVMGGALGEGSLAGGGSPFYFPLRGLPIASLARTRAMLFSSEYRFPLYSPQRGLGTTPFFLKNISGDLFADYGNAWNNHEGGSDRFTHFFNDFLLGTGAELRGDFVLGHGLPVVGRLGYGIIIVNRSRLGSLVDDVLSTSVKNGVLIFQLGTSF